MGYQLGLDTGGTYTDAVLVDDELQVVATAKSLTTHDNLIEGLRGATSGLLDETVAQGISLVSLSTTLATNALVEGRGRPVALVLIGFKAAQMKRAHLSEALGGDPCVFVDGGHNAGGQPLCELDTAACEAFVADVNDRVDAYALSGIFAVRNPAHERQLQALITQLTGKPVTCGHHLSSGLDAPRRALTALLNARLIPMLGALLSAARELLEEQGIQAPLMVVKGDGSLISDEMARTHPVETILSGPAASVVGAQFLCNQPTLLVSDMGGTTTDVALLRNARPQLNPDGATVGGWRTMVRAVDIRTYGLGGDSAIRFDRGSHLFTVGPQRVVPLSLLTLRHPELLKVLEAQLLLPYSTTYCAQFVMVHGNEPVDLSSQQAELYARIKQGPIAVNTLFSDQTLDRALVRLEQRGVVLRAGFTPSDASHVLGTQRDWQTKGSTLGARLLMRYSADNLGAVFADEMEFARSVTTLVARQTAMLLVDTVMASSEPPRVMTDSQKQLIRQSLHSNENELFRLNARISVPVAGLGAPAHSYYPEAASLLGTELVLPQHAEVANALGAVVGTIRQEQVVTIAPAGGKQVSVLFPDGPEIFADLEAGAAAAQQTGEELVRQKAVNAGASEVTVTVDRHDTTVKDGVNTILLESCITIIAVGRPATAK